MIKHRLQIFFLLLIITFSGFSQKKSKLSGFIRDAANSEPLIGAIIYSQNNDHYAVSDVYGHYTLHNKNHKTLTLNISFTGYKTQTITINVLSDTILNFNLVPGIEIEEVLVKGNVPIENSVNMSMHTLPLKELKQLPALGEADIIKVMQLMPGIQGGAEGRSGLYVRGGSPDQNLIMLDGTSMYYVNHYGNFLSLFHPEIISNLQLYKGAFPARYGGRMSSVIDLRMRQGNNKQHKKSIGIGLLSADLLIEGPIKKDTTSYIFSFRRFYLDALIRPITYLSSGGFSAGYKFFDLYGKISHVFSPETRFFVSIYIGEDAISSKVNQWNDNTFNGSHKNLWGNIMAATRLNTKLSNNVLADFALAYTSYKVCSADEYRVDSINFKNHIKSQVHDLTIKSDFKYSPLKNIEILIGAGGILHRFNPAITSNYISMADSVIVDKLDNTNFQADFESYTYIENTLSILNFVNLNLGMRYSNYFTGNTWYNKFEPRLMGAIGNKKTGAIKISYAQVMQSLHLLSNQNIGTPSDVWLPVTASIPPAISTQWILAYAKTFFSKYEFSVEAYKKQMVGLITYKEGVSFFSNDDINWQNKIEKNGKGETKGIEFYVRKNEGNTTGWIAYTWAKSQRLFENINGGKPFPFTYDRQHDLNIIINHNFNSKYNLSATWNYGSGYPITLETGYYKTYDVNWEPQDFDLTQTNPFIIDSKVALYSPKNSVRFKNYHRLDIAFQINGKTKKGRNKIWTFNIYNLFNNKNPAYYYYDWLDPKDKSKGITLWQQSGIPIMPSVTYRISW